MKLLGGLQDGVIELEGHGNDDVPRSDLLRY